MTNRIIIILIIIFNLSFAMKTVEVKVNQPGQLIIEVEIDSAWISQNDNFVHSVPNLSAYFQPGLPILPYWEDIFIGLPANADVKVYRNNTEAIENYEPILGEAEKAKGEEFELPILQQFEGSFPNKDVILTPIKDVDNLTTTKIEIFPFSISDNKLFYTKNISVHITWRDDNQYKPSTQMSKINSMDNFKNNILNKPNSNIIPEYQFYQNIAKIVVDTSAWYSIKNSELIAAGIDLSEYDINTIRLWNKDEEERLLLEKGDDDIFNKDDILIFYGEKNPPPEWADYDNNFYTNDNVYWLTWGIGNGKRFVNLDVSPYSQNNNILTPVNFIDTKKIETDGLYVRLGDLDEFLFTTWDVVDHFFISPQIIVSGPFDFEFELDSPDLLSNDGFNLEVQIRGRANVEHDIDIFLNNNKVENSQWSARDAINIEISNIDCSILNDGKNTLSLNLSPNDSTLHDLVYLNWYKIEYPKLFHSNSDYINFSTTEVVDQTVNFEITGFSTNDVYIFKNRVNILQNFNIRNDLTVSFQDIGSNASNYEIITKTNLIDVKTIVVENPITNLLQNINEEYVIIAPDSFFTILEPLKNYHAAAIVEINDIYRQYSYGVKSPYGIKSFIRDIYTSNQNKLKYVLIAMNSDWYNWRAGTVKKHSSIPTMNIHTYELGAVSCDYWYSYFDDNIWLPNISIGRLPVSDKTELTYVVNKTMYHHDRGMNNWDNNIILLGGRESTFRYQSESLINGIKNSGIFIKRLYVSPSIPDSTFFGTKDTLLMHLNDGLSNINFFGHGGGGVWADNSLLHRNDMDEISNNNKLPFVTSMTCFTGDFSYPIGLGKLMLTNANGGALAWYSASGLGWNYNDYYMTIPLQELLFSDEDLTIGEIINLSKTKYYLAYSDIYPEIAGSQLFQYNLIGDPAIKLKKSIYNKVSVMPVDPEPDEQIDLNINHTNVDSVHYQIFQPDNSSLNRSTFLGNISPFEITIPDTFSKGIYDINLSYKVEDQMYSSSQMFSVSGSYVNIQNTIPQIPTICDSIGVVAKVIDRNGISSVQLFVNDEYWSDMMYSDSNLYVSTKLIPPQPIGSTLNIYCMAIDAINDTTISNLKSFTISETPEIFPISGQFQVDDYINLVVEIESATTTPVEVFSDLYLKENNNWRLFGQDTIYISGSTIHNTTFSGFFPAGENEYRVITKANISCQSNNNVTDDTLTFELETNAFWVTPELGSTDDGQNHSKIGIKDVEIEIQSGIVTEPSIIQIENINSIDISSQPDFEVLKVSEDYNGIEVKWEADADYVINWTLDRYLEQYSQKLYQYYDNYRVWLPIDFNTQDDSIAIFNTNGSAKFTFLENNDIEKPTITATVNNQKYLENIYINANPNIQFSLYDKNGIDFRESAIKMNINNQNFELGTDDLTGSGNTINLEISPIFTEHDSSISILSKDAAGNNSDTLKVDFIVSEELDIIDYGNYPNPFTDKTVFAYELTETVDKLTFKIYSLEGRLIKKLKDEDIITGPSMKSPGYHELEWDGKNSDRKSVDNGNYFYKILAKKNKNTVNKSGKIVKAK